MRYIPEAGRHPPSIAGVAVAVLCVVLATVLATLLTGAAAAQTLNAVYLPGIVVVSCLWGLAPGLGTAVVSTIVYDLFVTPPAWSLRPGQDAFLATLAIFLVVAALAATAASRRRPPAAESEARDDTGLSARFGFGGILRRTAPALAALLEAARDRKKPPGAERDDCAELRRIAVEQGALRNLATLVAQSAPPSAVFDAVAREMAHVLGTPHTVIARYEPAGTAMVAIGTWNCKEFMPSGSRWELEEGTVGDLVHRTGKPGRVDACQGHGRLSDTLRDRGVFSSVGCPIIVGGDLWGVAIASSTTPQPLPADTEPRMQEFTELAATAIANAQYRADLIASRARVVAATDETRRRIERDLHDGTQQNLVSIALELRAINSAMPPELTELRERLAATARDMDSTVSELQEISRGLHPSVLSRGGLKQALTMLARRSGLTVRLDMADHARLPERVEVTVYYVIAEALNAARHAEASEVRVIVGVAGATVRLGVRHDGVGGADPARGSGLSGLADRVTAIGGRMKIVSPPGQGTTLTVEMPCGQSG